MKREFMCQPGRRSQSGFTLVELVFVIGLLTLLACLWAPALARTKPVNNAYRCQNNLRQLGVGWRQWAEDNNETLLTCQDPVVPGGGSDTYATPNLKRTRPVWVTGNLDFNGANRSNWDINQDIAVGPMWNYIGKAAGVFKCPADASTVLVGGQSLPRVRSISMSQVFSRGEWLDNSAGTSIAQNWRTYWKSDQVVLPSKTFVFLDEHPDSINDAAMATTMDGNRPTDPPAAAYLIDFPASYHNGACGVSFFDGHAETHHWQGATIRNAPLTYTGQLMLRVPAGSSWMDTQWLAQNTTVHR